MYVDRERLSSLLFENGKDQSMNETAMNLMEPFFVKVESGKWELRPMTWFKDEDVVPSIAQATGKEVKKIVFISRARPFPKPDWMTHMMYEDSLQDILPRSKTDNFGHIIWDSVGDSIEDKIGNGAGRRLTQSLWHSLGKSLHYSLWDSLEDSFGHILAPNVWDILWRSVSDSLFAYLGFTLSGDREKVEQLTPLIELLPHAIPLSEKRDEPGTWLVLCA